MIEPDVRIVQAEVFRALGCGRGTVSLSSIAAGTSDAGLQAAIDDLQSEDLVQLGNDGILRSGARGSILNEEEVQAHLATRKLGRSLEIRASVESTNDVALELAMAGRAAGMVVGAELQTAGRGRRGRAFESRPGLGLWTTSILDAPVDVATAPRLSLVAGIAVCRAVERMTGVRPALKWPNDVLVDGRKICGVLVEARSVGKQLLPVAGIGLNVHHRETDFPVELRTRAGSLESTCRVQPRRSEVLANLLNELELTLEEERSGALRLTDGFAAWDAFRDCEVELSPAGDDPETVRRGVARGVDEQGRLQLESPSGTKFIQSGDVSLRRAGP